MRENRGRPTTVVMVADDGTEVVVGRLDACTPDLGLVDVLARMQLEARRRGWRLRLRDASPQLVGLLELVGLASLSALEPLEPRRQPELGEQLGEEEVVQPGDPPV